MLQFFHFMSDVVHQTCDALMVSSFICLLMSPSSVSLSRPDLQLVRPLTSSPVPRLDPAVLGSGGVLALTLPDVFFKSFFVVMCGLDYD